tara:strand:+ start:3086 stop:3469 length:384 start_codon:yes stop_codon:yes gene_type:complete
MFNIIRHCEIERAKNTVEYKRFKTGTNDPTITRRKRFADLMKSSKTARVHNFKEKLSQGTIFVASQGQHANDYPSYRYASGQIYAVPISQNNDNSYTINDNNTNDNNNNNNNNNTNSNGNMGNENNY